MQQFRPNFQSRCKLRPSTLHDNARASDGGKGFYHNLLCFAEYKCNVITVKILCCLIILKVLYFAEAFTLLLSKTLMGNILAINVENIALKIEILLKKIDSLQP